MIDPDKIEVMDWHRILMDGFPPGYLGEIAFRTTFMFLFLIILLKFLSKRGVKQMSVFELAILIALGSATGDPMFYQHIPITHGVAVLLVVIILYKAITWLTSRSRFIEVMLEGKPKCLLTDGVIDYKLYRKMGLPYDKFFAELRLKGVNHLGQVRKVYLETSGELSVYFFSDDTVKPGLQIYPEQLSNTVHEIKKPGHYACRYCGKVQELLSIKNTCSVCGHDQWTLIGTEPRIK
jgi:uncharacterized membrane protein YcaP (DUF421 family)